MFIFAQTTDNDPFWYRILERFFKLIIELFDGIQITTIIVVMVCLLTIGSILSGLGFIPNFNPDRRAALFFGALLTALGFWLFFNPVITEAEITKPQNNQKFSQSQLEIPVEVRVLDKRKNEYLWLVNHSNLWFPQTNLENCEELNNIFVCQYWIEQEIGTHILHILATNKQVNQQFQAYVDESKRNQLWNGIVLPKDGIISEAEVTVEVIE
jgi:hypothetical protein